MIDTGLHTKGWFIKEAEQFQTKHFGYARTRDIYRCMAIPVLGCAYSAGYLRIRGPLEAERKRLGEDFDIREFHESLLSHGAVPLTVLERSSKAAIPGRSSGGLLLSGAVPATGSFSLEIMARMDYTAGNDCMMQQSRPVFLTPACAENCTSANNRYLGET